VAEELVAEAFALAGAFDQTGDINEFDGRGEGGLPDGGDTRFAWQREIERTSEPLVRARKDKVGNLSATGVIGRRF
jgi:hypothetical protein